MMILPIMSCDVDTPEETETDTSAPVTDVPETEAPALRPEDEELYIGYGRACLTPYDENGVLIEGYTLAGVAEPRNAKTVRTDLYASCTAAKDGELSPAYNVFNCYTCITSVICTRIDLMGRKKIHKVMRNLRLLFRSSLCSAYIHSFVYLH